MKYQALYTKNHVNDDSWKNIDHYILTVPEYWQHLS